VDYAYKSRCCGGMLTSGVPNVGLRLVEILLDEAKRVDADAIVATCSLCQYNLECFQDRLRKSTGKDLRIPVMYFTQLIGMALGIDDKSLGMNQLLRKPKYKPGVST
jgi:heterodisulfide reductase subunit B